VDFGKDHVFGRATPYVQEQSRIRFEVETPVQYGHMLTPCLEAVGVSLRQFLLLWAMRYGGTRTVANLTCLAGVETDAALDDIRALERDGHVTVAAPPTEFDTPQVDRTGRYRALQGGAAGNRAGTAAAGWGWLSAGNWWS